MASITFKVRSGGIQTVLSLLIIALTSPIGAAPNQSPQAPTINEEETLADRGQTLYNRNKQQTQPMTPQGSSSSYRPQRQYDNRRPQQRAQQNRQQSWRDQDNDRRDDDWDQDDYDYYEYDGYLYL